MSYHLPVPRVRRAPVHPQLYALDAFGAVPLVPLSEATVPAQENAAIRKMVIGIVVAIIIAAIVWWLNEQRKKMMPNPRRRRASRQSTQEMARNLYRRLEGRGGASDGTMRSLAQLGRGTP